MNNEVKQEQWQPLLVALMILTTEGDTNRLLQGLFTDVYGKISVVLETLTPPTEY